MELLAIVRGCVVIAVVSAPQSLSRTSEAAVLSNQMKFLSSTVDIVIYKGECWDGGLIDIGENTEVWHCNDLTSGPPCRAEVHRTVGNCVEYEFQCGGNGNVVEEHSSGGYTYINCYQGAGACGC